MRDTLQPLRSSGFRALWLSYTTNELGNWLGEIALALLVFDQTGSALAATALFLGMQFVPALVAPALVAKIEPIGIRRVLPAIYAGEAVIFAVLALLAGSFSLIPILVLAAIDGALAIAGRTFTRTAVVGLLAPGDQVRQGNTLINFGFTITGAAGPAIAGVIVAGLSVQTALLLDAASFLLVSALLALNREVPDLKGQPEPWWTRLREGIDHVRSRAVLLRLLCGYTIGLVFLTAVLPIEVVFIKDTLGQSSSAYGFFLAAWGAGMIAGSLVFAVGRDLSLQFLLFVGVLANGLAYLGLAGTGSLGAACAVAAVGGAGNGVFWVAMITLVQRLTESDYQARVVALLESIGSAAPGLGFVIGGVSATVASPRLSFLLAGAGTLAVLAAGVLALRGASWEPPAPQAAPGAGELPALGAAGSAIVP